MNEEIKIITLGDIFKNIETEEKAFKFKDYIKDLQQKVEEKNKEIDRLSNIINELEKWLIEQDKYLHSNHIFEDYQLTYCAIVLDKLKELKEDNKE